MKSINLTYITLLLSLIAFASCINYLTSKLVEISRTYSPDSTKFLFRYVEKIADWDTLGPGETIILKANERLRSGGMSTFYSNYLIDSIYWRGNDTVVIEENYASFKSLGKSQLKDTMMNDVHVKIVQRDPIDSSYTRKVYIRETSPDGKYELLVYKYLKPVPGNYFLNVSVIDKGDSIPKFGNFYISVYNFIAITDIRWDSTSVLDIKTLGRRGLDLADYLVNNRPNIKYKAEVNSYQGNVENDGVIKDAAGIPISPAR